MKTVLSFLLLLVSQIIFAQKPQWDSTYRPGIYAMKVEQFRAFPNASTDIVF